MSFNQRMILLAEKLRLPPCQIKIMVYSLYGNSTISSEEMLGMLEKTISDK